VQGDRASAAAWAPLRDRVFRATWVAFLGAQVIIWAQTVGAVDVITEQSSSAALVALIQTAVSLPGVVLALLAGAVADTLDRRRLLVAAGLAMAVAMAALAALTVAGAATPVVVLMLIAALGAGLAMFLPAFSAMVRDIVSREMLAPAMAITGVSVNVARAAGPALAGAIIAVAGAGGLFWVLSGGLVAVVGVLAVYGPPTAAPPEPERIGEAMRAGARFARFSAPLRGLIVRTGLFVLCGASLWALLPLVAVRNLGLDASGFGVLLACVGAGAVFGATVLPPVTDRLSVEAVGMGGSAVPAAVLATLTLVGDAVAAALVLFVAGAAWLAVLTGLMTGAQVAAPAWVRGRAFATWLLAYQGGLALGGFAWGLVAEWSLAGALLASAATLLLAAVATRLFVADTLPEVELEPHGTWADPVIATKVDGDTGPVLVTVEYEVVEHDVDAFVAAMEELSEVRRRDGALRWHLYRDVEDPRRFVETFSATTWREHLRLHERGTQEDLPLEERVVALTRGYAVRHLVSALMRDR
jgi:MFS family permease